MALFDRQEDKNNKISGTVDSYTGRRYTIIDDIGNRHFAESSTFYPPGSRVIVLGEVIVDQAADTVEPTIFEV